MTVEMIKNSHKEYYSINIIPKLHVISHVVDFSLCEQN